MGIFHIDYLLTFGIYLIGFGVVKGVFSERKSDIFNINNTKNLYSEIGMLDTIFEFLSLFIVYVTAYILDYEKFTIYEMLITIFGFLLVYRFLFWGITGRIRSINNSNKK